MLIQQVGRVAWIPTSALATLSEMALLKCETGLSLEGKITIPIYAFIFS
jgi:hypothetical protein